VHSKRRETMLRVSHLHSRDGDALGPQSDAAEQGRRARHQEHGRYAERHPSEHGPAQCQYACLAQLPDTRSVHSIPLYDVLTSSTNAAGRLVQSCSVDFKCHSCDTCQLLSSAARRRL